MRQIGRGSGAHATYFLNQKGFISATSAKRGKRRAQSQPDAAADDGRRGAQRRAHGRFLRALSEKSIHRMRALGIANAHHKRIGVAADALRATKLLRLAELLGRRLQQIELPGDAHKHKPASSRRRARSRQSWLASRPTARRPSPTSTWGERAYGRNGHERAYGRNGHERAYGRNGHERVYGSSSSHQRSTSLPQLSAPPVMAVQCSRAV